MRTLLLSLLVIISKSSLAQSEQSSNPINYDTTELVVRLNFKYLNWDVINNKNVITTTVKDLLNGDGIRSLEDLPIKSFDPKNLIATKIFPFLTTADSISIGRQGNKVNIPPFWATFNIDKPQGLNFDKFIVEINDLYPLIIYAHPNFIIEQTSVPNDTLFSEQLSLHNTVNTYSHITHINVDSAWNIETGKDWVKVGIFDTGIDSSHADIDLLTGWNNSGDLLPEWGVDQVGHGTNVAGIIGAKRNNITGIAGIAGGDGTDTTGVSLIDFKYDSPYSAGNIQEIERLSATIIDAARSPGSYYQWNTFADGTADYHYNNSPGYGILIGNHSYNYRLGSYKTDYNGEEPGGTPGRYIGQCELCQESFLFSLQNGVTSVVSRGNKKFDSNNELTYTGPINLLPSCYDDSWVVSVGASGTNGERLIGNGNPTYANASDDYYSIRGRNVDIIAPGTHDMVYTAASQSDTTSINGYSTFNGTSAAAPHATGVAALLVSYYNKPCYSNLNLDPADIEYILQKSATKTDSNIVAGGYAEDAGWGLLNANEALKMIELPTYQIIHPQDVFESQQIYTVDTISIYYHFPLSYTIEGPIGSQFPIETNKFYKVERKRIDLTYNFGQYIQPNTQLLDVWLRNSQTNSLKFVSDTTMTFDPINGTEVVIDTLKIEPYASLTLVSDSIVKVSGYYYHIIGKYQVDGNFPNDLANNSNLEQLEDIWYPINPNVSLPQMAFSIYIKDSTIGRYDFSCDSANLLLDSIGYYAELNESKIQDIMIYPNPGHSKLSITGVPAGGELRLLDIWGRLIKEINNTREPEYSFDVQELKSGVYFVNYTDGHVMINKKWIKQ